MLLKKLYLLSIVLLLLAGCGTPVITNDYEIKYSEYRDGSSLYFYQKDKQLEVYADTVEALNFLATYLTENHQNESIDSIELTIPYKSIPTVVNHKEIVSVTSASSKRNSTHVDMSHSYEYIILFDNGMTMKMSKENFAKFEKGDNVEIGVYLISQPAMYNYEFKEVNYALRKK